MTSSNEPSAYATLLLQDLQLDPALSQRWNAARKQAKTTADLDTFLSTEGYICTFKDVQASAKQKPGAADLPNAGAWRFFVALQTDAKLRAAWQKKLDDLVQGSNPDVSQLDAFLTENGFGTTSSRVNAVVRSAVNQGASRWTGSYGKTLLQQDGPAQPGPALRLWGPTPENPDQGVQVTLNDKHVIEATYDDATFTLSWSTDGGLNQTSAELTFTTVDAPTAFDSYVGNEFTGTLTLPDKGLYGFSGPAKYSGRTGDTDPPAKIPPSQTDQTLNLILSASVIIGGIVGGVAFVQACWALGKLATRNWDDIAAGWRRLRGLDGGNVPPLVNGGGGGGGGELADDGLAVPPELVEQVFPVVEPIVVQGAQFNGLNPPQQVNLDVQADAADEQREEVDAEDVVEGNRASVEFEAP